MRKLIAQVFFLVFIALGVSGNEKRDASNDPIYQNIAGDWQGSLKTDEFCAFDVSCSYNLIFNDKDYTFYMIIGGGCFKTTTNTCRNYGNVTAVTRDTITLQYKCPGCFCDNTNAASVEFCYRYKKPTAMRLHVAMYRSPSSLFNTCPPNTEVSCKIDGDVTESVALGVTECMGGACMICNNAGSCSNRGVCNDNGTCNCFYGFTGPTCNVSVCTNSCSGHGICDVSKTKILMGMSIFDESQPVGVCRCFSGWAGPTCSSPDIFSGRQKLWEGLIFVGIVSTVAAGTILLRKFIYPPMRQRSRRSRHRRHHRSRVEVEMEEFVNPL